MRTNNAPRSNNQPGIARRQEVSYKISERCKLPGNRFAVNSQFIDDNVANTGVRTTPIRHSFLLLISFLLMILFYGVIQNNVFAGSKLIDELKFTDIQEKKFSLHFDKEHGQLQVNGIMDIGILSAFKNMLIKHPELTAVVFNSKGGNIYQARGLANIIISKALNTHVSKDCYSACTIAYMAGKVRYMSPNGRLGFHQYNMKLKQLNQRFDLEKEQAKDLSFFKTRIADNEFIKKIFNSKNSDLWIPRQNDLLKTGVIHVIVPELER